METHMDVPGSDVDLENERQWWQAGELAKTWMRNWTDYHVLEIRPLSPGEQWLRGVDPDPAKATPG
jgi:hypothetical protein